MLVKLHSSAYIDVDRVEYFQKTEYANGDVTCVVRLSGSGELRLGEQDTFTCQRIDKALSARVSSGNLS